MIAKIEHMGIGQDTTPPCGGPSLASSLLMDLASQFTPFDDDNPGDDDFGRLALLVIDWGENLPAMGKHLDIGRWCGGFWMGWDSEDECWLGPIKAVKAYAWV